MSFTGAILTALSTVFGRAPKADTWYVSRLELPELCADRVEPQKADDLARPVSLPRTNPAPLEMMPILERERPRQVVTPGKFARLLVKYLQDGGATGVYTAAEIDELCGMAADQLGLFELPCQSIREQLQSPQNFPGLYLGRRATKLDFVEVRRRTGLPRATLYRIPAKSRAAARQTSHGHGKHGTDLSHAWQTHGSDAERAAA